MEQPSIGDKIRFKPGGLTDFEEGGAGKRFGLPVEVTGTVVQVFPRHRTYRVSYELNGRTLHETFKF